MGRWKWLPDSVRQRYSLLSALTGYDTPEAHVMAAAAGFDHHIAKPVNFGELTLMLG